MAQQRKGAELKKYLKGLIYAGCPRENFNLILKQTGWKKEKLQILCNCYSEVAWQRIKCQGGLTEAQAEAILKEVFKVYADGYTSRKRRDSHPSQFI
jgi:hypothetical protein